jgi:WD40 repeat protein
MARIWDAATGTVIRSFRADSRLVLSVEFSPDGQRVITVGSGTAKVWDVNNKNELSAFPHAQILSARFSQTGDRVLTSPGFGETRVWDVQTGKKLATLEGGCYFNVQTTSPDDRWIATNPNGTVRIYDAKTFGLKHVLKEDSWIRMASFSPDGTQLLTTAEGLTTTVWDVVNGVVLDKIAAKSDQRGWVGAGFSPNGKQFFVERLGTDSNSLKGITIYDATTRKPRIELRLEGTNLDLNPDGSLGYFLWEGAFSPDGKRFVGNFSFRGSARNNKCLVWNVDTGKIELSFSTHSGTNYSVAFSLDGKRIVTGGSGVAKVWDAESGLELLAIPTGGPVGSVAFNRDGTKLIIANGSEARIFDGTPLPEPKK